VFIVNDKSHCCNETFTDVLFTSLLAKKTFKRNTNFYALRISIPLAIVCEILSKSVTFSKSYARKQQWVFFSEHSVALQIFLPMLIDESVAAEI